MQHFKVPTMMVVWPDDSPEHPHYVATPLHNCKPDPLTWLAVLAGVCDNPPDVAKVYLPQPRPAVPQDLVAGLFADPVPAA
jgi:hypothetical protein